MAIRIGINGFGRIGRMALSGDARTRKNVEVVAVNDITDATTLAHLLKHDSVHGSLKHQVKAEGDQIMLDGHAFRVIAERDPAKLPWKELEGRRRDRIDRPVHRARQGGAPSERGREARS